jgi:Bifunctional DNA primase/polymerase, N-terminal/AAA domain/Primase C terminal 1 (PriCT-1)
VTATSAREMVEAALQYAERGVPVFQCWHADGARCGCRALDCASPAKHPIASTAPAGFKNATTDPAIIRRAFELFPHANIAEATGHYSVVLDVDPAKGGRESLTRLEAQHGRLPVTARVLTGGGGEHYRFLPVPGLRCSEGRVGPGLDIRAEGGYALLPPSNHVSGGLYLDDLMAPMFETPLAPMPSWLLTLAMAPVAQNGHEAGTDWPALLAGAPQGERHATATRIAGHLLGKRLDPAEVETILLGYAGRCVPPFDARDVRRIVHDLARKDQGKTGDGFLKKTTSTNGHHEEPDAEREALPARAPVLVCLGDVAPEAVSWSWKDRVAFGKLTVIVGLPGTGKTNVTLDMMARTTVGAAWPDGGRALSGAVLLLGCEDGLADTVRPVVDRQGGDARLVHVLQAVRVEGQDCPFNLERDLPALGAAIEQTDAALVVISPLSAYLGKKDSYRDAEMRSLLTPLAAMAEQHRVAIVGIMHSTKSETRRLLLRAGGSIAFVAQARTVLVVGEDADTPGRRLLVSVKNNLGAQAPSLAFRITDQGLTWDPTPVDGTPEALLAGDDVVPRAERREREQAVAFLRDMLADGAMASKQIMADAKANGIAQRTLWRAKTELHVIAERGKGQTGAWYWMLPRGDS